MKIKWNRVTWYSQIIAIVLFVGVFFLGLNLGAQYNEAAHVSRGAVGDMATSVWKSYKKASQAASSGVATTTTTKSKQTKNSSSVSTSTSVSKPATSTPATPPVLTTPPITTPPATTPASGEIRFSAYLTAYTYWDNTPPGSSDISNPIVHQKAGGTGTYSDPITLAVGHSFATGKDVLDYAEGTKFYLPYLKRYFIVEDTCGDGSHPENGPCHTGYQGHPWLDLWIDGANGTRTTSNTCAEDITEVHLIIQNPASNYVVIAGPVYNNGCAQQFSDTPVTS